jgi:hypothetical protein
MSWATAESLSRNYSLFPAKAEKPNAVNEGRSRAFIKPHSFRSGLASALHAAGVEDGMIQLICRWMCPESLHVYRRMGVAEHEALIRRASGCHVDCTQSVNVPTVVGDQHMAALTAEFSQLKAAAEIQAYEHAVRAAMDPFAPQELHLLDEA